MLVAKPTEPGCSGALGCPPIRCSPWCHSSALPPLGVSARGGARLTLQGPEGCWRSAGWPGLSIPLLCSAALEAPGRQGLPEPSPLPAHCLPLGLWQAGGIKNPVKERLPSPTLCGGVEAPGERETPGPWLPESARGRSGCRGRLVRPLLLFCSRCAGGGCQGRRQPSALPCGTCVRQAGNAGGPPRPQGSGPACWLVV